MDNKFSFYLLGIVFFLLLGLGINSTVNAINLKTKELSFDQKYTVVNYLDNAVEVKLSINNPYREQFKGSLYASIVNPAGNIITSASQEVKVESSSDNKFTLNLPTTVKKDKLKFHKLEYSFRYGENTEKCPPNTKCVQKTKKIDGSLVLKGSNLNDTLAVRMFAQNKFLAGAAASFRLVAFNPQKNETVANAKVDVNLVNKSNNLKTELFEGETNKDGTVNANFVIPENKEGQFDLNVVVMANNLDKATEEINQPITIKRDYKIMLTTDKPLYQPNQTIKIRALALNTGTLKPVSTKGSTIEVYDSKGNKVFKKVTKTNEFGIISAEFTLADEINMGNYKIKAIVDNIESEKTVNISRYVLPKFKVAFKTDKDYYLPAETVKGSVDVNYFFGKPVKGGKVTIKVDKFDIGFSRIEDISGTTDQNGHFDFEIKLPDTFVGQNIVSGNALVKFDIEVKDTADHIEKKTASTLVSQQPINIVVIPESGSLVKNLTNNIYIMTTYPDGSPASTAITGNVAGNAFSTKTDSTGIAVVTADTDKDSVEITVDAVDSKGNKATKKDTLTTNKTEQSVLLRTDKAVLKVGDTLNLQTISTKSSGTVYIDMIKNDQTVLTKSMDLKNGRAEMALDVPDELVGTVGINAYIIDTSSEIVKDSKIVYVNPAQDLLIDIIPGKKIYKPAEEAVIKFKVTDTNKHPILSALGVYVVDESVFALSEMQPGLEKVFFTLEEEILKPRFEIHGLTPEKVIMPEDAKKDAINRQQKAAKVLFAAAEDLKDYPIKVDTYKDSIHEMMSEYYQPLYNIVNDIRTASYKYYDKHHNYPKAKMGLETLIKENFLKTDKLIDPWNNKVAVVNYGDYLYYDFMIISKGPDGKAGTADDIVISEWGGMAAGIDLNTPSLTKLAFENPEANKDKLRALTSSLAYRGGRARLGGEFFEEAEGMMFADGVAGAMPMAELRKDKAMAQNMAPPAPAMRAKKAIAMDEKSNELASKTEASGGKGAEEVRVREYFPETLYDNPSIITDANGEASITIPMADSITEWRLTAMANSLDGLLGSNTKGIKVFQDFFIDIDLPVALTQNDKVSIPIAIYNYLPTKQTIKLQINKEDWFDSVDETTKSLEIEPNQVSVQYFTLQVKKLGNHTLTVYGYGSKMSDAIKRQVRVEPDGKEFRDAINGRLDKDITHTVVIPENSIDDASRILVKIYPGYLSQVIEGMDKIFRMPSGCFEQTSSTTYPNILVLDYMKRTKQISPEVQMKAESYINSGYQRLLTFEVPGGGFDWFGRAPANKILTAYGLMEFYDMSAVHEVDQNLITRTQNWLVSKQEADGSWKPDEGGIAEGAINKYQGQTLRTTAYIGWALSSSAYKGPALDKAIKYVKSNINKAEDPYTCAVIANFLVGVEPEGADTDKIFTKLLSMKTEKEDMAYWEQKEQTPMYGDGKSANVEATALATIALINYGKEVAITNKALTYLVKNKDTYGTWYSTQATILAMKALLMSLTNATAKINANITVNINGKDVETYKVDETNSDVVKQIDLKELTKNGKNDVSLKIEGKGSLLYQIVSIYYTPWKFIEKPKVPILDIDVDYDKTTLEKNDMATAMVTVKNNIPETANMVIVDLGIPPGFEVQTEDLDKMVSDKVITKYSIAARQVILYFDKIKGNDKVEFKYKVKAKISIKAQSGQSKVYKYYEPEVNSVTQPKEITVN